MGQKRTDDGMISTDQFIARVRARGERLTIQRRLVIEALCERGDHLGVQDVQRHLVEGGCEVSETTVYRILQWLKDIGMVSQTDLGRNGIVYQVLDERPHHHLVCLNCGAIRDVDDTLFDALRATLRQDYDFEPRIDHMAIFGVCNDCQDAAES